MTQTVLPAPRLGDALVVALSATVVLWVPLTLLPIIDGLLFTTTAWQLARDVGLLWLLAPLPAALLAALAVGAYGGSRRWLGESRAAVVGWTVLLLPLLWIVVRQFVRMVWQWIRAISASGLEFPPSWRGAALAIGSLLLLALLWRIGWSRVLRWSAHHLRQAFPLAAGLLLLSLALVVANPPQWWPMRSQPATASATTETPRPSIQRVLIITLDAVAAADANACNPASVTMPALARFAQGATCFERFYAAGNFTTATTSTLETGLLPWSHHANQPEASMVPEARTHTLPAQLRAQGWRTHMLTDNLLASPRHRGSYAAYDTSWLVETGLIGNLYREWGARLPDTSLPRLLAASLAFLAAGEQWREHDSPYNSEAAYGLLDRLFAQESTGQHPQFVWLHTLPPHSPYLPPSSTRYTLLPRGELERWDQLLPDNIEYPPSLQPLVDKHRLRYRESLMAADAALGAALERLQANGVLDQTLVIISTDHGESFQQGFLGHAGPHLHEPLIHGPLVIRMPGQREGRRIAQPVSQADLAPTLIDLLQAPPLPRAEGRSLRPLLEGQPLPSAPVLAMALERQSRFLPLRLGSVALIEGEHKLLLDLASGRTELHRIHPDRPEEVLSNATLERNMAALLRARLPAGTSTPFLATQSP